MGLPATTAPKDVVVATTMAAVGAAHLATLLKWNRYPDGEA